MRLSAYEQSDLEEIEKLFAKVFTDSAGEVEGSLIGKLVSDMAVNTDARDISDLPPLTEIKLLATFFYETIFRK